MVCSSVLLFNAEQAHLAAALLCNWPALVGFAADMSRYCPTAELLFSLVHVSVLQLLRSLALDLSTQSISAFDEDVWAMGMHCVYSG